MGRVMAVVWFVACLLAAVAFIVAASAVTPLQTHHLLG